MFKEFATGLFITSALALSILSPSAQAAVDESCRIIGGVGMPNLVPQSDGTITIVAPLSGSVATAAGKITGQRETATGLEMDMEHYFMTEDGGFMHTKDLGVLTKIVGKEGQYMIEITYDIQEATSSGSLKGYSGTFNSYGLMDVAQLEGLIRYNGEICR